MASAVPWGRMCSPERTPSVTGENSWGRPKCSEPDTPRLLLSEDSLDSRTHGTRRTAQVGGALWRTANRCRGAKSKKRNLSNQFQFRFRWIGPKRDQLLLPRLQCRRVDGEGGAVLQVRTISLWPWKTDAHSVGTELTSAPVCPVMGCHSQCHLASRVPSVSFLMERRCLFSVLSD